MIHALVPLVLLAGPAVGPSPRVPAGPAGGHDLDPTQNGAWVGNAGDANLDGFADIIVGAWWDRSVKEHFGSATVFSGKDAKPLYIVRGEEEGALFGIAVAGAGDVDDDGASDFIVGAPWETAKKERAGVVRVYSGRDGKVIHELQGDSAGERYGFSVNTAGDVNQDGFDDFVVGAPDARPKKGKGEERVGRVRVYSGKNAKLLHEWFGEEDGDLFGHSVDSAGDVDGDGSADLVVGAWGGRYVRVFSGRKGDVAHEQTTDEEGSRFGWTVRRAGDVDQNGMDNVIIGVPWGDKEATRVIDSKSGDVLFSFEREADGWSHGIAVDGAGDVNADGFADLVIGDPGFPRLFGPDGRPLGERFQSLRSHVARPGRVVVLSGNGGELLYTFEGDSEDDCFGASVSTAGDVNQDGFADVVVGAGPHVSYHARVYSGQDGEILHTLRIEP